MARNPCYLCFEAQVNCYCGRLRPFRPRDLFVFLMHPAELRRTLSTGRMAHRTLVGSRLLVGEEFSTHAEVGAMLADPGLECLLLFPRGDSEELSARRVGSRRRAYFILDGTWRWARGMFLASPNLQAMPRVHLPPGPPSRVEFRKQPREQCLTTIETAARFFPEREEEMLSPFLDLVGRQRRYRPEAYD